METVLGYTIMRRNISTGSTMYLLNRRWKVYVPVVGLIKSVEEAAAILAKLQKQQGYGYAVKEVVAEYRARDVFVPVSEHVSTDVKCFADTIAWARLLNPSNTESNKSF